MQSDLVRLEEISLSSGIRMRYARHGPADGPAVVLLHGYSDTWFSFSRVLPLLPSRLRGIVPDQRGHGGTERPEAGYDVEDFARDVLALMDGLGIESATLVGHSMGSFVARRAAALAPSRVERLVLLSTAPLAGNATIAELRTAVAALTDPVDREFVREFQVSTFHRPLPAEFVDRVVEDSARMPARVWKAAIDGLVRYVPAERGIRCPTLVLGGDRDTVFSKAEQQSMALQIPGAVIKIVADVGHALHWEDPARFVHEFKTR